METSPCDYQALDHTITEISEYINQFDESNADQDVLQYYVCVDSALSPVKFLANFFENFRSIVCLRKIRGSIV